MSRKFKIRDQEAVHFVTFTTIHWLDVFIRPVYRDIFLESTLCQKNKGLVTISYESLRAAIQIRRRRCGMNSFHLDNMP